MDADSDTPVPSVNASGGVPRPHAAWRTGLGRILTPPFGDPVHAIYGTVITAGLIASQDSAVVSTADITATVLVTVVVFWLAHGYAQIVGRTDTDVERRMFAETRESLAAHWPMVQAAVLPLGVLLLVRLAGASIDGSQEAALWTSTVLLALWGYVAGRARRLPRWRLLGFAATSFLLGVILVGLESSIH
nr:hypothetical protein [Micromonospora sp. DSM 115978]